MMLRKEIRGRCRSGVLHVVGGAVVRVRLGCLPDIGMVSGEAACCMIKGKELPLISLDWRTFPISAPLVSEISVEILRSHSASFWLVSPSPFTETSDLFFVIAAFSFCPCIRIMQERTRPFKGRPRSGSAWTGDMPHGGSSSRSIISREASGR
jgi:hypothetical protein